MGPAMPLDGARTKVDLRGGRNSDLVFARTVGLWWADDLTWGDWPRTVSARIAG